MASPDAFSLAEGALFHDQYEVVRRIDSGAMGAVYEVLDRRTKRRRALKVMLARFADNPEVAERFRREATITADVVSEHVVETYDAGVDKPSGLPFLVMELLRGEDLGKLVARGPIAPEAIVTLLMQAAGALDRMHAASIIHRDLKPENLYVTRRDDGSLRIKILDFGIAKVVEKASPSATTTRNMGTPVYMSPEQVTGAGPVGPPTDLYALGHLGYTMLVGEAYWLEDALAHDTVYPLLLRIMEGVTEPASERALRTRKVQIPKAFDVWFAKATAHDSEARFARASDSIVELALALNVSRPPLPSGYFDVALMAAPTLSPPDDEPIDLLPRPPAVPALLARPLSASDLQVGSAHLRDADGQEATEPDDDSEDLAANAHAEHPKAIHESHRTLSPVSTLPGSAPGQPDRPSASALEHEAPVEKEPSHRRVRAAVIWLGAAFFLVGVIGAVVFTKRGMLPSGDAAASGGAPSTLGALAPFASASASGAPSAAASEPRDPPLVPSPPSGTATAPSADPNSQSPAPTAEPSKPPPKRPLWGPLPKASTSTSTRPTRAYGDPIRDL